MPVATQVKRRRGTAEENNAFTGAEGEITVDLTNKTLRVHDGETLGGTAVETQRNKSTTITAESTDNQYPSAKAVVDYVSTNSGGAMPVGAIFTTPRTGTIGGAVEANGGEYNIADYSGEGSIGALLSAGNIAYVSKTEFQTQVTNAGACDSFGWNGDGDTTFLVPKLLDSSVRPDYSQSVQRVNSAPSSYTATEDCIIEVKGTPLSYDLYSGSTEIIAEFAYSANYSSAWVFLPKGLTMKLRGTASQYNNFIITPVRSSNATRYMVQLATGATDQALETCTSVLSDVSALNTHRVIEFQAPTAANGYTWYRKYADGWVEQGGRSGAKDVTITIPVAMSDNHYVILTDIVGRVGYGALNWEIGSITTTGFHCYYDGDSSDPTEFSWQVSGMAAQ